VKTTTPWNNSRQQLLVPGVIHRHLVVAIAADFIHGQRITTREI
jgi:hypothetical protein